MEHKLKSNNKLLECPIYHITPYEKSGRITYFIILECLHFLCYDCAEKIPGNNYNSIECPTCKKKYSRTRVLNYSFAKLTKRELLLIAGLIFFIFVIIGIKNKLQLSSINRLSTTLGITEKKTTLESLVDFFLIGIGARK